MLGEALPGAWDSDEQEWIPDDRDPTVHATWTVAVTVAKHNTEDVNAHFIDIESNAPPKPTPYWLFTGSWDATNSYTKGWGPLWGEDEQLPSLHPKVHSIHGSNNTDTTGELNITSGKRRGFTLIQFSGAYVHEVIVICSRYAHLLDDPDSDYNRGRGEAPKPRLLASPSPAPERRALTSP